MSEAFGPRDGRMLRDHLTAIVEVEFFTIPVYLTAVYSFTNRALSYSDTSHGDTVYPLFDLQQQALSVAVQEMYHLQLACNIANAFDTPPTIPKMSLPAGTPVRAPHLDAEGAPLELQLGNLREMINAAIQLEGPDPQLGTRPQPNPSVEYPSIDDLYFATLTLLERHRSAFAPNGAGDSRLLMDHKQVAYTGFASQYRFNKIQAPQDVITAANAIVDQGEGNDLAKLIGGSFQGASTDDTVLPQFRSRGSRFDRWNGVTHFKRFSDIGNVLESTDWERVIGGPIVYESDGQPSPDLPNWAPPYPDLQDAVTTLWSYVIDTMQGGFASGALEPAYAAEENDAPGFSEAMMTFKYILPLIWQYGHCPSLLYKPGVTAAEAQAAMDTTDPLCLFHWDKRTREVRATFPRNACQGLNTCAGQGWGGIGTRPGDGACATADFHTCGANNSCKLEGGCGFLVSRKGEACGESVAARQATCGDADYPAPWDEWHPGVNLCGGTGGCQTPISTEQVFNRSARPQIERAGPNPPWNTTQKEKLANLSGANVWERARDLFAQRVGEPLPEPHAETTDQLDYDGNRRRKAIAPTSR